LEGSSKGLNVEGRKDWKVGNFIADLSQKNGLLLFNRKLAKLSTYSFDIAKISQSSQSTRWYCNIFWVNATPFPKKHIYRTDQPDNLATYSTTRIEQNITKSSKPDTVSLFQ